MSAIKPKISVIVPAYNTGKLLKKCVDSIACQDYPKDLLEIIVVDDGSTDETGDIADNLSQEYSNVKVIHQTNSGSSGARNHGIESAGGEYIGFVDSDDYVDPRMYGALVDAALNFDADMVQISRDEIAENGERLPDVVIPPDEITTVSPAEHLRTLLMHTGDASFCTKLVKRSLLSQDLRFPVGELNEDFHLMIRVLERINKLVILPNQYYHVFYRTGSNSRKDTKDKDYFPSVFTDIVRNSDVVLDLVNKKHPELLEVAKRFGYYQRLDYLLHIPISKMTADNTFYMDVVKNIRGNLLGIISNKYLGRKQKIYLCILSVFPRFIRTLHAKIKGL